MADIGLLERLRDLIGSRRFQWILTIALAALVVLYLLFVSVFFNPFEEKLEDTAAIVPAEVDYFVRWRRAGEQFSDYPRLAVWDEVEGAAAWSELERSGAMAELGTSTGIDGLMNQLAAMEDVLPAGLNMEDDFLREVAVAGNGKLAFNSSFDGVLMLRGSFKVRAGIAMLNWGFVQNKLPDSVQIDDLGGGVFKLPQFELFGFRDAYLTRIKDVVLLASDRNHLERAIELDARSGQESLAHAANFHDYVTAYLAPGDRPVEAFFRWRPLADAIGTWPDPSSEGTISRLIGRFFDTSLLRFASGFVDLDASLDMRVSGDLDLSEAGEFRKRWLEGSTVSAQRIKEFADMTPADCFFFGTVAGDPGLVLQEAYSLLEPDLRAMLDEAVQDSGRYQGMGHLMQELGGMLRPGIGIALRRDDYPPAATDPDHDNTPVPLWAIYGSVSDPSAYEAMRTYFVSNWRRFTGGTNDKIDSVKLTNNAKMTSFVSPIVPGTGEIVVVYHSAIDVVVVSNSYKLLNAITQTAFPASSSRPPAPLRDDSRFERTLDAAANGAHMLLWMDPSNARHWLEEASGGIAESRFQDERQDSWRERRPGTESRLREELFPGRAALSPQEESRLNDAVDAALLNTDVTAGARLPALTNEVRLGWLPTQALDWASAVFRISRRTATLRLQAEVSG